jgi:hypothetical protein
MENPDLTSVGIQCGFRALANYTDGVLCFMENGFTEACAVIWVHGARHTRQECPSCTLHAVNQLPNNLEPPTCYLAECIQCDEDMAGPIFQEFAARTRRRAGLISGIVRNCTDIPHLVHRDPCDDDYSPQSRSSSPSDAPTMAPTDASSSSRLPVAFLLSSTLFLSTGLLCTFIVY